MKLTDQEIIEARRRAFENNPRSYEAWYEVLNFGREIEKDVLTNYTRDYSKEIPHQDGWYIVAMENDGSVWVATLNWSGERVSFSQPDGTEIPAHKILRFKKLEEFVEEAGLNPPLEEEGSLAQQGVEDGEIKNVQ